jgi:hypothetical protein
VLRVTGITSFKGRKAMRARRPASRMYALAMSSFALLMSAHIAALAKPETPLDKPVAVAVTAIPIDFDRDDPGRKQFGKLIFRNGLNLYAKSRHFGGFSGLVIDPSGDSILAVSDAGTWMRAGLTYNGRYLKGLSDVTLGPVLATDGKPLRSDADRDSEALSLASGDTRKGTAYLGFERKHRIAIYPFTANSFGPPGGTVALPAGAKRMRSNQGIEALAAIKTGRLKGTLLVFSERLTGKGGDLQGWLIGGPLPGTILLKRLADFDITDAAALPDGGVVILERRFRYSEGVQMRIRRISQSELKPGALIKGEVLLEANDSLNIDNMEAIAAHRASTGETVITLMSDDNFSPFQRNLIMQFALPDGPVLAGPRVD